MHRNLPSLFIDMTIPMRGWMHPVLLRRHFETSDDKSSVLIALWWFIYFSSIAEEVTSTSSCWRDTTNDSARRSISSKASLIHSRASFLSKRFPSSHSWIHLPDPHQLYHLRRMWEHACCSCVLHHITRECTLQNQVSFDMSEECENILAVVAISITPSMNAL